MFDRLFSNLQGDAVTRALRDTIARLPGQPVVAALDLLHGAVREGLAASPAGPTARRLLEQVDPTASAWSDQAWTELALSEDNPVRRDLIGQRLALLATQLANASYIEAQRESAQWQRGNGKLADLSQLAATYFRWLGVAHGARALLNPGAARLSWSEPVSLYLALIRSGALSPGPQRAADGPAAPLAYLALCHDAFKVVSAAEVALAARICHLLAPEVVLAADFHRITPLVMDIDANEASRIVGWNGPREGMPALCMGLEACAAMAHDMAGDLRTGKPLPWWPPSGPADLFDRLETAWALRRGRGRHPAAARVGDVLVAFDFLRIRGLLGQKGERVPGQDPYVHAARLDDADEAGLSLLLPAAATELLESGLMAINIANQGWWLGHPVRLEPLADGELFVAVRWLAQEAESIRLTSIGGEVQRALYLKPCPVNDYQTLLLLDHDWLPAEAPFDADLEASSIRLIPGAPVQLGVRLWCYPCRAA
ncbi:hypothetical protein [Chitinimonas sp. BJYL2]|uniref:hypothetical protein n=1 Tax=Chitinimonas sp. BJYL2 TaxID=2976696 RepID=UPI0022B5B433|nr:hypothetical protein [Chitinimonas sp. BJYL2]